MPLATELSKRKAVRINCYKSKDHVKLTVSKFASHNAHVYKLTYLINMVHTQQGKFNFVHAHHMIQYYYVIVLTE